MITAMRPSTIKHRDYQRDYLIEAIEAINDADMFRILKLLAVFVSGTFNSVVLVSLASVLFPALKTWRIWTTLHEVRSR
jgi:hypothetical protein